MKKTLLLSALCLCTSMAWAQPVGHLSQKAHDVNRLERLIAKNGYQYKLTGFRSNDNYQMCDFHYNSQNQLVAVVDSILNDYCVIDSLFYNEQGQMVRLSGWQRLARGWENVYYIDYTYDPSGNRTSRTNYNNYDGEWTLGGVYEYSYNADNQLILTTLTMSGIQFQKVEYTYQEGLLSEELWYSYNGSSLDQDEKLNYRYTADGRLSQINDSIFDGSRSWIYNGLSNYLYDDRGNCTEYHQYDNTHSEATRSEFHYMEDISLNETLMPWTPEMVRPETYSNVNVYDVEHFYSLDVNHHLQHMCDFLYTYSDATARVLETENSRLHLYPNPATKAVTLDGIGDAPAQVYITDLVGRIALTTQTERGIKTIDVSTLPVGCYTVRLLQQGNLHTARLIIN